MPSGSRLLFHGENGQWHPGGVWCPHHSGFLGTPRSLPQHVLGVCGKKPPAPIIYFHQRLPALGLHQFIESSREILPTRVQPLLIQINN